MLFTSALKIFILASAASAMYATGPYGDWKSCPTIDQIGELRFRNTELRLDSSILAGGVESCVYTTKIDSQKAVAKLYRKGDSASESEALQLIDRSDGTSRPPRYIGEFVDPHGRHWLIMTRLEGLPIQETAQWAKLIGIGRDSIDDNAPISQRANCALFFVEIYEKVGSAVEFHLKTSGVYHLDPHLQNVLWDENMVPTLIDFGKWAKVNKDILATTGINNMNLIAQQHAKDAMDWETNYALSLPRIGRCHITMNELNEWLS